MSCSTIVKLFSIVVISGSAAAQSDGKWVDPASPNSGAGAFYVRNGVGANLLSSISLDNRANAFGSVTGAKIHMDTGVAWELDLGWRFSDLLSVEFSTGLAYNSIDRISGTVTEFGGGTVSGSVPLSGYLLQVPFMAGVNLDFPLYRPDAPKGSSGLWLRIGASVGGIYALGQLDTVPGVLTAGSDSDVTFAYGFSAALDWRLNQSMAFGVAYRFLGTGSASFNAIGIPNLIETSGIYNQQVMGTFSISF